MAPSTPRLNGSVLHVEVPQDRVQVVYNETLSGNGAAGVSFGRSDFAAVSSGDSRRLTGAGVSRFPANRLFASLESGGITVETNPEISDEERAEAAKEASYLRMEQKNKRVASFFPPHQVIVVKEPGKFATTTFMVVRVQGTSLWKNQRAESWFKAKPGDREIRPYTEDVYIPLSYGDIGMSQEAIKDLLEKPGVTKRIFDLPTLATSNWISIGEPIDQDKGAISIMRKLLVKRPEAAYYEDQIRTVMSGKAGEIKAYVDPEAAAQAAEAARIAEAALPDNEQAYRRLPENARLAVDFISQNLVFDLGQVKQARQAARTIGRDLGDPEGILKSYDEDYLKRTYIPWMKNLPVAEGSTTTYQLIDINLAIAYLNQYYFEKGIVLTHPQLGTLNFDTTGFINYGKSQPISIP